LDKMLEKKAARKARKAAEAEEATRTAELAEAAKAVEVSETMKAAEVAKAEEAETSKEATQEAKADEAETSKEAAKKQVVKPEEVEKPAKSAEASASAQDEGNPLARRRAGRAAWADMLPETPTNEAPSGEAPKMPVKHPAKQSPEEPAKQTQQLAERPEDQLAGQPAEKPIAKPTDVVTAKKKSKTWGELDVVACLASASKDTDPGPRPAPKDMHHVQNPVQRSAAQSGASASRDTDPGPGPAPKDIHHGQNPVQRSAAQSGGSSGSRSKPRIEDEPLSPPGPRPSSNLSPIDKELFKYEKKVREIEKLRQKQAQGEELDTLQLEKLDREQHVGNKIAELQLKKALQHSTTCVDGEDRSELQGQHAQQQPKAGKGDHASRPKASGARDSQVGRTPLRPPRLDWRPAGSPPGMAAAPEGFAPFANDSVVHSNPMNGPMVFQANSGSLMMPDSHEAFQLQPVPMGSMPMAPMEMQTMGEMQPMEMQVIHDMPMASEEFQDRWECCWEWVQYGYCPRGDTCRWEHPPRVVGAPVDYGTGQQIFWAGGDDAAGCGHVNVMAMVPTDYPSCM